MGTPVVAAFDGTIKAGTDPSGGNVIIEKLSDGSAVYYAHLSAYEGTFPRPVQAGDTIGYVGMTGSAAKTVPHLHYEHWSDGTYTSAYDPMPELRAAQRGAATTRKPFSPILGGVAIVGAACGVAWLIRRPQRRRLPSRRVFA
jgi:murein DD-endopeptidase MepM/ murein hydrolase activator NlpD